MADHSSTSAERPGTAEMRAAELPTAMLGESVQWHERHHKDDQGNVQGNPKERYDRYMLQEGVLHG